VSARTATLFLLVGTLLAACGASNDASAPAPPSKGRADVKVTLDGAHHLCNIALATETQASSIACSEVVSFFRDELRLPSGAVYELRADGKFDPAELATLSANLQNAGYRSTQ
jgi:hypothetical protein